ncbi:hypothetical protein Q2T40_17270 [Winogradskyella maritima]|uniref:Addiction module component n=1 Tax=Winogradskyella maritima TaxID=1517766 RepID=A0ABV8AGC6_9FLAO|nr:hypothetical protein [Winogradskyella maritima]
MGAPELRDKLIRIIKTSDEKFLRMVNALHMHYANDETTDFYGELPHEIQDILMESRAQAQRGETRPHADVMQEYREKYGIAR